MDDLDTDEEKAAKQAKAGVGHNGYDGELIDRLCSEIEDEQAEIDAIMAKAADDCRPFQQSIKDIKKRASEEYGLPIKEFNGWVRRRKYLRKAAEIPNSMHEQERENFDHGWFAVARQANLPLFDTTGPQQDLALEDQGPDEFDAAAPKDAEAADDRTVQ
jgi:hypothetical protein